MSGTKSNYGAGYSAQYNYEVKEMTQGAQDAEQATGALTGAVDMLGGRANIAATSLRVFKDVAVETVKVYGENESAVLQTQALMKSMGSSAGLTSQQIAKLTDQIAYNTLASKKDANSAANALMMFRGVQSEVFKDALKASQDMAATYGGDMTANAKILGKALQDPLTGLKELTAAGIEFTGEEQKKIQAMVKSGKLAEAQGEILKKVNGKVKGNAETMASGVVGAIDKIGHRWNDLVLSFGKTINVGGIVTGGAEIITDGLDDASQAMISEDQKKREELTKERDRLKADIAKYSDIEQAASGRLKSDFQGRRIGAQEDLKQVEKDLKAVNDVIAKEAEAQKLAKEKAAEDFAKFQKDQQEKRLKAEQAVGAKQLAILSQNLLTEKELIEQAAKQRAEVIQKLKLSDSEIAKRNFDNIEDLRKDLLKRNQQKADLDIAALGDKPKTTTSVDPAKPKSGSEVKCQPCCKPGTDKAKEYGYSSGSRRGASNGTG